MGRSQDVNKLCDSVFSMICDALKEKLRPAFIEIFNGNPDFDYTAIDLSKIVSNVLPNNEGQPADFVFKYEKDFLNKQKALSKKISQIQKDVQNIGNRVNVFSRKTESCKKELKVIRQKVDSNDIDSALKIDSLQQKITSLTDELSKASHSMMISPPSQQGKLPQHNSTTLINGVPESTVRVLPMGDELTDMSCDDIKAMRDTFTDVNDKVESLQRDLASFVERKNVEAETFNRKVDDLSTYCEQINQYGRRNSLEIINYKYTYGENTNLIAINIFRRLGINICLKDIDRSHRNPPVKRGDRRKNSVILVKLLRHDLKEQIYNRRHLLRELPGFHNIYINENLTPFRRTLYSRVRNTFRGRFECWTNDGKIHLSPYVSKIKTVLTITSYADFHNIINDYF